VLGEQGADRLLSPEHLRELVPDLAERDVYVCGPVSMTAATRASLRRAGVPDRHIVSEAFG
jgi:ferredoxin-NADP reductase